MRLALAVALIASGTLILGFVAAAVWAHSMVTVAIAPQAIWAGAAFALAGVAAGIGALHFAQRR